MTTQTSEPAAAYRGGKSGTMRAALAYLRSCLSWVTTTLGATQRVASEGEMPSLDGATAWLNSAALTPADLRGKVVLIQFWTYTCIEWLRTFPIVNAWAQAYGQHGLIVIGVHTPEHSFEHDIASVQRAVNGLGIRYPVVIDNHYTIWGAFQNRYSPAFYVVDSKRRIRHRSFGEGDYEQLERLIRQLLREAGAQELGPEVVAALLTGADGITDGDDPDSRENSFGAAPNGATSRRAVCDDRPE